MARITSAARHFPRNLVLLGLLLLLLLAVGTSVQDVRIPLFGDGESATQPGQQIQIGPAPVVNPPAQTEPEVVAPATKEWPMVEVGWEATNISNRSPNAISAIPTEQGLYNGDSFNLPNDRQRWEERRIFADSILPQLNLRENNGVSVTAVRSGDVTVVHIEADGDGINGLVIPLLLSVDGEKTWCKLTKVPSLTPADIGRQSNHLRLQVEGEIIRLYAADSSVGVWWWTATVKRNELPCS